MLAYLAEQPEKATPRTALELARKLHADRAYDRQLAQTSAYARENFSREKLLGRPSESGVG